MSELPRNSVRSGEEEVELKRSTKKVKEHHPSTNVPGFEEGTFKDKLLGDILDAYAQAFNIHNCTSKDVCDDPDLDTEMVKIFEGIISVKLSNSTISHIHGKWIHALIVKVFGKRVGFHYLHSKIMAFWKPSGRLECIDLSRGFFLIRLGLATNFDFFLK